MTPTNVPHELLPGVWRSVANQWDRGADVADSYQDSMIDRAIARTYRRLAAELERAINEAGQRRSA